MKKSCKNCNHFEHCVRVYNPYSCCIDYEAKPQTNEEWLRSCPPQELIRFLMNVAYGGQIRSAKERTFDEEAEKWSKWLKEKHNG